MTKKNSAHMIADAIRNETGEEFRHRMDDELCNPLCNIALLALQTDIPDELQHEVSRIVKILEREKIINPRLRAEPGTVKATLLRKVAP